jgi:uncharacterized membrane protein YhaH (DUF805 family)
LGSPTGEGSMLQLLFGFSGRANRLQYWSLGLLIDLVLFMAVLGAAGIVTAAITTRKHQDAAGPAILAALALAILAVGLCVWIRLAVTVRRLHDRNKPGALCLLTFLPMALTLTGAVPGLISGLSQLAIYLWMLVELGLLGPVDEDNQYGTPRAPNPACRTSSRRRRARSMLVPMPPWPMPLPAGLRLTLHEYPQASRYFVHRPRRRVLAANALDQRSALGPTEAAALV